MIVEDECLLLLDQSEQELEDTLKSETRSLESLDKELVEVEGKLDDIRVRVVEISEQDNPNMEEVEELYRQFLELSSRQSQLMQLITIKLETVGICESALY